MTNDQIRRLESLMADLEVARSLKDARDARIAIKVFVMDYGSERYMAALRGSGTDSQQRSEPSQRAGAKRGRKTLATC